MTTVYNLTSDWGYGPGGIYSTRELAEQANTIIGGFGYIEEITLDVMPEPIPVVEYTAEQIAEHVQREAIQAKHGKVCTITREMLESESSSLSLAKMC
jgi:hypothetical protein